MDKIHENKKKCKDRAKSDENGRYLYSAILNTFCFLRVMHTADKAFCAKKPQICFSNIKHKGKTLTASEVNKSLPRE